MTPVGGKEGTGRGEKKSFFLTIGNKDRIDFGLPSSMLAVVGGPYRWSDGVFVY